MSGRAGAVLVISITFGSFFVFGILSAAVGWHWALAIMVPVDLVLYLIGRRRGWTKGK